MADVLHGMIVERQRLLIREANYLRGLVGLPPVRADANRQSGVREALRRDGSAEAG